MTNTSYTHLLLIADRSGSMGTIADDMNGGIKTTLDEQAKLPGDLLVTIVTFDNTAETIADGIGPQAVKHPIIVPRGGTALFDAIGKGVTELGEKLAALPEDDRPGQVIVVIVTDGQENASTEWTKDTIKELVEKQEKDYNWDFIFLGANIDSAQVGGGFGLGAASTLNYTADAAGTQTVSASVGSYLTARRGGDHDSTLADLAVSK